MGETFLILLPQMLLIGMSCLLILGGSFAVSGRIWTWVALLGLMFASAAWAYQAGQAPFGAVSTNDPTLGRYAIVVQNPLTILFQGGCLIAGVVYVLMSANREGSASTSGEFYGLLLLVLAGGMLAPAANELVLLYLSLELISLPTYVLLYLSRKDHYAQEASTKYFLLSVMSAAVLLYGFALLYGITGSTNLTAIRGVLLEAYGNGSGTPFDGASLGTVALMLIFAGLGFKLAAVPFHFYAPDVYEGSNALNASVLSVIPKAAALAALVRVVTECFIGFELPGERICMILAGISIVGGNCLALLQTHIRRMLAYSGIAHSGYMLLAIASSFSQHWSGRAVPGAFPTGVPAAVFYLGAYSLATLTLFAVLSHVARHNRQIEHIDDLTGLGRTHPMLGAITAISLFSLAGIPPLPGFWAKFSVFYSAFSVQTETANQAHTWHPGFVTLAIIGALMAAVGAAYYLRIVALMYLNDPLSVAQPSGGWTGLTAVYVPAVLLVVFGLFPGPVFQRMDALRTDPLQPPAKSAAIVEPPDSAATPPRLALDIAGSR